MQFIISVLLVLPTILGCSSQASSRAFESLILEQGWECTIGQKNCWRNLELHADGTFIGTDAEGNTRFFLTAQQLRQISAVVGLEAFEEALHDESGQRCGSFFGSSAFFTVTWVDGETQRASAAGCLGKEEDIYSQVFEVIADLRQEFIECVDRTAPGFEDHDAVREGRIRGLCVPCSGNC